MSPTFAALLIVPLSHLPYSLSFFIHLFCRHLHLSFLPTSRLFCPTSTLCSFSLNVLCLFTHQLLSYCLNFLYRSYLSYFPPNFSTCLLTFHLFFFYFFRVLQFFSPFSVFLTRFSPCLVSLSVHGLLLLCGAGMLRRHSVDKPQKAIDCKFGSNKPQGIFQGLLNLSSQ